jgi:hypothetical protein
VKAPTASPLCGAGTKCIRADHDVGDHLKGEAIDTSKAFFFKSVSKAEVTATRTTGSTFTAFSTFVSTEG